MPKSLPRRLLTVGHSYVIRSNRRLPEAIQAASNGEWQVTVAAPSFYAGNPRYGDLRPEHLEVAADERVEVVGVPVAFSSRVHFALYGRSLRRLMCSRFDAIHCWEEPFILSAAQMAMWAPRDALLTFFSAQNINKRYPPPFGWLEKEVMRRADGWVAGATLVERALKDRTGYRQRPHRVIGFGIDPYDFKPDDAARSRVRGALGWDAETPVIGYLGRLTEAKGLAILMRVLDRINAPWNALLVGSGPLESELRKWSAKFDGRVQMVTGVEHARVPAYLNAMDILVAPSQTTPNWREQFGRMLIEAFACKVAVVASDSGEIPFVVANAGRVVGETDELAYQRNIEELLSDPVARATLAQQGYRRVQERYTWSAIGAQYLEMFNSLSQAKHDSQQSIFAAA